MDKSREIAVKVLTGVFKDKSYSNILLGSSLNKSNLEGKDKALTTEIVYGTLKYKYTIDKILSYFIKKDLRSIDIYILNILRSSVYQIRYLDRIPEFAAVNEAVEMTKKEKGIGPSKFVNAVLRNYLRSKNINFIEKDKDDIDQICFDYSFEPWMVNLFLKQYGKENGISIMEGLNEVPGISVRINPLKGSYHEIFSKLLDCGFNVEKGYINKEAINIIKGGNIEQNELFRDGFITVQDESAMLVASSMEIQDNMTILDLCSAPGGKATHICEILNNTGVVKAFDLHANKLKLIEKNAKRLGIKNLNCSEMDSRKYNDKYKEIANRVLIDVPCSGLGIIKKKPEIKWNKSLKDLKSLIKTQRSIMINAAEYVKSNGYLIYSTCTLNSEENEENIQWFLNNNKVYKIEPLYFGKYDNIIYSKEGWVTIMPNKYMDGFFICKLRKIG
ncbi:16S rRNA (cytosine(967)-C(5))-methyltransferase RsmB [Clostridium pasteurianum]|uniref:16S rRNA (cytosine(967)-C(5))-methyltransferase n=1 Tax=Clostridium pasteurianum BC1 TaxID=86416 RepID=R4KCG9_CLOPA|nr:16S rRNA (cytosine(967)-C(5))-methyltransferase RsmB [Clostridium pasteurianum]AGK97315.1 ribosomal RNA small subunit methyltransferase RsmB [Clostridium pasteurianum BC1]